MSEDPKYPKYMQNLENLAKALRYKYTESREQREKGCFKPPPRKRSTLFIATNVVVTMVFIMWTVRYNKSNRMGQYCGVILDSGIYIH